MNSGRVVAIVMILAGIAIAGFGVVFSVAQYSGGELTGIGPVIVGIGVFGFVGLVVAGIGVVVLNRSRQEAAEDEERAELRKILDLVKSKGQVQISEVVIDLGTSTKEVQDQIHSLVGMGLFSGYINWDEGTLYSEEAANIRDLKRCKVCGGEVEFAGKGVVACPYCGTEYFLS